MGLSLGSAAPPPPLTSGFICDLASGSLIIHRVSSYASVPSAGSKGNKHETGIRKHSCNASMRLEPPGNRSQRYLRPIINTLAAPLSIAEQLRRAEALYVSSPLHLYVHTCLTSRFNEGGLSSSVIHAPRGSATRCEAGWDVTPPAWKL